MAEYRIHALYALLDELKTVDALLRGDRGYFEEQDHQLARSAIHDIVPAEAKIFETWCSPHLLKLLDSYAKDAPNFDWKGGKLVPSARRGLRNRHLNLNTKFLVGQAWGVVLGRVSPEEAVRTAYRLTGCRVPVEAVDRALAGHADKAAEMKVKGVFLALSAGQALHQDRAREGLRGELKTLIRQIGARIRARSHATDTGSLQDVSKGLASVGSQCPTPHKPRSPGAGSTRRKKSKSK